jgi:hypothetical protein
LYTYTIFFLFHLHDLSKNEIHGCFKYCHIVWFPFSRERRREKRIRTPCSCLQQTWIFFLVTQGPISFSRSLHGSVTVFSSEDPAMLLQVLWKTSNWC